MLVRLLICATLAVLAHPLKAMADGEEYTSLPVRIDLYSASPERYSSSSSNELVGELDINQTKAVLRITPKTEQYEFYNGRKKAPPKLLTFEEEFPRDIGKIVKVFHIQTSSFIFTDKNKLIILSIKTKQEDVLQTHIVQLRTNVADFGKIVGCIRLDNNLYIARQAYTGRVDIVNLETGTITKSESFFYGVEKLNFDPGTKTIIIPTLHQADDVDGIIGREGQLYYIRGLGLSGSDWNWTGFRSSALEHYQRHRY